MEVADLTRPIYWAKLAVASDWTTLSLHDQMVALVESILELHTRLAEARVPVEKERLQRQIEVTEREIDRLVYELYELTPAEIAVVEGG